MYTQCPKCDTVFKLSADVLRIAGGQVRCGRCAEVFNALARLSEDARSFAAGESALDLEARADSILESAQTLNVARTVARDYEEFAPPGVEIAHLEVMDWTEEDRAKHAALSLGDIDDDAGLEEEEEARFDDEHGTEDESEDESEDEPGADEEHRTEESPGGEYRLVDLENRLDEHRSTLSPGEHAAGGRGSGDERGAGDGGFDPATEDASDPSLEFSLPPGELDRIFVEFRPTAPHAHLAPTVPELHETADLEEPLPDEQAPELEIDNREQAAPAGRDIAWYCGAAAALLLLAAQVVHHNREWLVAHAPASVGALLRTMYAALGAPLPAPINLAAYQLRQWGVTEYSNASGMLHVRASILNTAAQPQPYPLLRVTLTDRFGKGLGRRDFEPAEYLGKPAVKPMAPGERADASLGLLDPGKNAEGFEIDVCLRADQRLACANDAASQAKR